MFTFQTPQTFHQTAFNLFQQGRMAEAIDTLKKAISIYPQVVDLWQLSVAIFAMSGQLEQAEAAAYQVIRLQPNAQAYYDLGLVFQHQKNWDKAETAHRQAISLNPSFAEAYNNLGLVLHEQQRFEEAIEAYHQTIHYDSNYARVYTNLGITLEKLEQLDQAIEMYLLALKYQPNLAEAYNNLADALKKKHQYQEALIACQQALQLKPNSAEIYHTLALILKELGRDEEAVKACQQALQLKPDFANIYKMLGIILDDRGQLEQAIPLYYEALRLDSELLAARNCLTAALQKVCAWKEWQPLAEQIIQTLQNSSEQQDNKLLPFWLIGFTNDPQLQQRCARQFAAVDINKFAPQQRPIFLPHNNKLKIGYLSADFKQHPLSYLMAEVFELHNRGRFEVIGYSIGGNDNSDIRNRIQKGFDQFHDLESLSLKETANCITKDKIDILVDLTGYTAHSRTAVLALRPAPIQIQFLGYPGTLGTPHADYIIADEIIIPEKYFKYYDEKVVWMPDTYQPNDRHRVIAHIPSKIEAGLPENKFVFCCFNASYKILPDIFQIWMRLLKTVPNSVLWLIEANSLAVENLRREAQQHIDPQRLIFAPKQPLANHLARLSLADLALDTLPYNAHTTMSDALWAGIPAISCTGESFASRVGASLLKAAGLSELITTNLQDYEKLALELATNPTKLASFKKRLNDNKNTCALFDTPRWVRNIETGYEMMWKRFQKGLPPEHLKI